MDLLLRVDLAGRKLGGASLFANDDFFCAQRKSSKAASHLYREASTLILESGWTAGSRAARTRALTGASSVSPAGNNSGRGVDTSFFRGNYPEHCSLEACTMDGLPTTEEC